MSLLSPPSSPTINKQQITSLAIFFIYSNGNALFNIFYFSLAEFEAQTAELIPKQGETRAKVVFLLTLNGRALRQVRRLIRALYSSSHYFYIHVDSVGNQSSSNHI